MKLYFEAYSPPNYLPTSSKISGSRCVSLNRFELAITPQVGKFTVKPFLCWRTLESIDTCRDGDYARSPCPRYPITLRSIGYHDSPNTQPNSLTCSNVLDRLVEISPAQAELLKRVCSGQTIFAEELRSAGTFEAPAAPLKWSVRVSPRWPDSLD